MRNKVYPIISLTTLACGETVSLHAGLARQTPVDNYYYDHSYLSLNPDIAEQMLSTTRSEVSILEQSKVSTYGTASH